MAHHRQVARCTRSIAYHREAAQEAAHSMTQGACRMAQETARSIAQEAGRSRPQEAGRSSHI